MDEMHTHPDIANTFDFGHDVNFSDTFSSALAFSSLQNQIHVKKNTILTPFIDRYLLSKIR
jgi:hypothetical protein